LCDTLQQNRLAERKNKHLLEVARALLFTNQVPKYLWGEAVLTATYLINRMPNKVLNFETPFDVFHKFYQNNSAFFFFTTKDIWLYCFYSYS
jgi:hypothetical protein